MLFTQEVGIDLGTANTLVFVKGKGIVIREPSVVAVDERSNPPKVVAVGTEAKEMIGRTPGSIVAVRPLKDGVIADFDITSDMLKEFIHRAISGSPFSRAKVRICIPSGVTSVERRAVHDAARSAGAKYVSLIEEPMAAAIGAGLPVAEPTGSMIVDIGGGTSEVAVLSMGGIVNSKSLRVAGDVLDEYIITYAKKEHSLIIGERTAEEIKITIGAAYPKAQEERMSVKGRDILTGLPKNIQLTSSEIVEALKEPVAAIIDAVKETLEATPPELAADVMEKGIMLTGGGALLSGLDKIIKIETGIPVHIAEDPLDCVARGTGKCLEDPELRRMLSQNRTMRKF